MLSSQQTVACGQTRYAKKTINVRASPNSSSKIVDKIYWNEKINVVNRYNKKWYEIIFNNHVRYIKCANAQKKPFAYKTYKCFSDGSFKSYEDSCCITDSNDLAQGKLKDKYTLDETTGVYMIENRYCIALGSYYTKDVGVKVDLVLENKNGKKHILKCITADNKANEDTVNNHSMHPDGSIVEFIVHINSLSRKTNIMGDISYANKKFKGKIKNIRIYK